MSITCFSLDCISFNDGRHLKKLLNLSKIINQKKNI